MFATLIVDNSLFSSMKTTQINIKFSAIDRDY